MSQPATTHHISPGTSEQPHTVTSTTSTMSPSTQPQYPSKYPPYPTSDILATTMNDLPGYKITKILGTVYGLTVRTRNVAASTGMALKGLAGGELKSFTTLLYNARNDAAERMNNEALQRGGNAIIAMRFETNEMGGNCGFVQVAAYGTAAIIEKIGDNEHGGGKTWYSSA